MTTSKLNLLHASPSFFDYEKFQSDRQRIGKSWTDKQLLDSVSYVHKAGVFMVENQPVIVCIDKKTARFDGYQHRGLLDRFLMWIVHGVGFSDGRFTISTDESKKLKEIDKNYRACLMTDGGSEAVFNIFASTISANAKVTGWEIRWGHFELAHAVRAFQVNSRLESSTQRGSACDRLVRALNASFKSQGAAATIEALRNLDMKPDDFHRVLAGATSDRRLDLLKTIGETTQSWTELQVVAWMMSQCQGDLNRAYPLKITSALYHANFSQTSLEELALDSSRESCLFLKDRIVAAEYGYIGGIGSKRAIMDSLFQSAANKKIYRDVVTEQNQIQDQQKKLQDQQKQLEYQQKKLQDQQKQFENEQVKKNKANDDALKEVGRKSTKRKIELKTLTDRLAELTSELEDLKRSQSSEFRIISPGPQRNRGKKGFANPMSLNHSA